MSFSGRRREQVTCDPEPVVPVAATTSLAIAVAPPLPQSVLLPAPAEARPRSDLLTEIRRFRGGLRPVTTHPVLAAYPPEPGSLGQLLQHHRLANRGRGSSTSLASESSFDWK